MKALLIFAAKSIFTNSWLAVQRCDRALPSCSCSIPHHPPRFPFPLLWPASTNIGGSGRYVLYNSSTLSVLDRQERQPDSKGQARGIYLPRFPPTSVLYPNPTSLQYNSVRHLTSSGSLSRSLARSNQNCKSCSPSLDLARLRCSWCKRRGKSSAYCKADKLNVPFELRGYCGRRSHVVLSGNLPIRSRLC